MDQKGDRIDANDEIGTLPYCNPCPTKLVSVYNGDVRVELTRERR